MTSIAPPSLPPTATSSSAFAYIGELALWDYECARNLSEEDHPDHRHLCEKFAEAGRAALDAMVAALPGPKPGVSGVISPHDFVRLPERLDFLLTRDPAARELLNEQDTMEAACLLGRTLLMSRLPAGDGFLLRDLYDPRAVADCEESAEVLVDGMTRRLLGLPLETLEIRFYKLRRTPMRSTAFWDRRWRRINSSKPSAPLSP